VHQLLRNINAAELSRGDNCAAKLQAEAYSGYGKLYELGRRPGLILEAACWVRARRPFS
jgi:hypothetical protein